MIAYIRQQKQLAVIIRLDSRIFLISAGQKPPCRAGCAARQLSRSATCPKRRLSSAAPPRAGPRAKNRPTNPTRNQRCAPSRNAGGYSRNFSAACIQSSSLQYLIRFTEKETSSKTLSSAMSKSHTSLILFSR